jgi:hypothetical protein
VKDQLDARERLQRFGPDQTVRVCNHADQHACAKCLE